jgi:hypothetical protein
MGRGCNLTWVVVVMDAMFAACGWKVRIGFELLGGFPHSEGGWWSGGLHAVDASLLYFYFGLKRGCMCCCQVV